MPASAEQRIARVVEQLYPETAFEKRYGQPRPLNERMAARHTPGASIAVINDFEIEWARGFGVSDLGTATPVTPTTLFQAGSISKPIFALAVMRLVQQGRLDLDAHVNTYLKSWKIPANGDWQPHVTLRHLLSHAAGLTVHGFPGYQRSEPLPTVVQVLNGEPPANTQHSSRAADALFRRRHDCGAAGSGRHPRCGVSRNHADRRIRAVGPGS